MAYPAIPSSGELTLSSIRDEFLGSGQISLSQLYNNSAGNGLVDGDVDYSKDIPVTGVSISFSQFRGAHNYKIYITPASGLVGAILTPGTGIWYAGFKFGSNGKIYRKNPSTNSALDATTEYGSWWTGHPETSVSSNMTLTYSLTGDALFGAPTAPYFDQLFQTRCLSSAQAYTVLQINIKESGGTGQQGAANGTYVIEMDNSNPN